MKKIGVETKVELPTVGTNVQEHLFAGLAYGVFPWLGLSVYSIPLTYSKELASGVKDKFSTIDSLSDPGVVQEQLKQ